MTTPDLEAIERELAAAREQLAALRRDRGGGVDREPAVEAPPSAPPEDATVWAAAHEGRLTEVRIVDPRAVRLGPVALAGLLTTAINEAFDRARPAPGQDAAGVDLALITRQLHDVRDEALGTLHRTMSMLQDAVAQLRQDAHVTMPAAVPDFQQLFAGTEQNLAAARGGEPGTADDLRGEGHSDVRGHVRATVAAARVESLHIEAQAMRKQPHELAGLVLAAVNAALQDLRDRQRESLETTTADRAERVRAVQDRSIAEMRAFCDAMMSLMDSIRPLS